MNTVFFQTSLWACLACACSSPSTSSPRAESPPPPPTDEPVAAVASSECFEGGGVVRLPNGQEVATMKAKAKRTLHPDRNEIVEEFDNISPRPARYVVTIKVDGNQFTMSEASGAFTGEGVLTGEAWKWTAWSSTSALPDGTRVESQDRRTDQGIAVTKKVFTKDGTLQVSIEEAFTLVPCS